MKFHSLFRGSVSSSFHSLFNHIKETRSWRRRPLTAAAAAATTVTSLVALYYACSDKEPKGGEPEKYHMVHHLGIFSGKLSRHLSAVVYAQEEEETKGSSISNIKQEQQEQQQEQEQQQQHHHHQVMQNRNEESGPSFDELELLKVQIVMRHCARTPITLLPNHKTQKLEFVWKCPTMISMTSVSLNGLKDCQGSSNNDKHLSSKDIGTGNDVFDSGNGNANGEEENKIQYETPLYHRNPHPQVMGNCMRGQLTSKGMEQCYDIGKQIRDRYLDQTKCPELFLKNASHDKIFVRSTHIPTRRTEHSAVYTLLGLLSSPGISTSQTSSVFQRESIDSIKLPKIHLLEAHSENMYPHTSLCKRLGFLIKNLSKGETIKAHHEYANKIIGNHLDAYFHRPKSNWKDANNTFHAITFHEMPLPEGFKNEYLQLFTKLSGEGAHMIYGHRDVIRLGIGRFMNDILTGINKTIQYDEPSYPIFQKKTNNSEFEVNIESIEHYPLMFYFGHDSTLIPLLCALDMFDEKWPEFGSHVAFELFKNKQQDYQNQEEKKFYIRIVYNGKALRNRMGQEFIPYQDFVDHIQQHIPEDYQRECGLPNWEK